MKRKLIAILLVSLLVLSFIGCSKSNDEVASNEEVKTEEVKNDETKKEDNSNEEVKMEEKVVVYSTHGEDMIGMVADSFEEETGTKVEFINLKGELAERVEAEKDNPQADLMYGGASNLFMDLKQKDVFEKVNPTWASDLDPMFKDKDNFWFGTIQTPVALFYNTEMLDASDLPNDWYDLTDKKYEGKINLRSALSSSARVMYSALIQQFDKKDKIDEGWKFMKALDQNTKQYFGSGSLMMQSIGRKEASISISTLNHIMDNKINNNLPIEIIKMETGYPVITDGIAVIKNAPHPNAAKAFLEYAGSPKVQTMLANEFNRMPTLDEAIQSSPEWMGEMDFKAMDVDWVDLANNQSKWMQKWDTEIKDSKKDVK